MANDPFEITYAAHTASCTFLLDGEGVCRRIVMAPNGKRRDGSRNAARCVGAQYVASLDPGVPGCLVEMPRVGVAMLFARIDDRGRVALVRTGVVTRFEAKRVHDPFEDTGQVSTSAPELPSSPSTPRTAPRGPRSNREATLPDDPYEDMTERTQPIQALNKKDLARVLAAVDQSRPAPHESGVDLATSEYESEGGKRRPTLPSNVASNVSPQAPTLRNPPVQVPIDDSDPYVARAQHSLPPTPPARRSEPPPPPPLPNRPPVDPYVGRMKSDRVPSQRAPADTPRVATALPAQWVGSKAAARRRGER